MRLITLNIWILSIVSQFTEWLNTLTRAQSIGVQKTSPKGKCGQCNSYEIQVFLYIRLRSNFVHLIHIFEAVLKKWSYLLVVLSVIITVGHNVIAHHHHFDEAAHQDHHDDGEEEHEHSIFSYSQLDESFTCSNDQLQVDNNFLVLCFISLELFHTASIPAVKLVYRDEVHPPPDDPHCRHLSFRGPPFLIS